MDINVLVTLLTVVVVLLSFVIITLLAIAIAVLVKLRRVVKQVDTITQNLASATDWIVPSKLISKLFRK